MPELSGTLTTRGAASRSAGVWSVTAQASGPAGIEARVAGDFNETTGLADIGAKGELNLGVANRMIAPNSVRGTGRFDLTLKGKPGLESLSGTLTTAGSTVAVPEARQSIRNIDARIALANARADLRVTGALNDGGTFQVTGPVALTAPFDARLDAALNGLVLTDRLAFRSLADGQVNFTGPLAGNGAVSGLIRIGRTEIDIAAGGGAAGAAPIPEIAHVNVPGAVQDTRRKAGLIAKDKGAKARGPVHRLNLVIDAPKEIYVRGRGLQAELGGNIRIGGTTAQIAPSGQIGLIRGHFDLLGRRLALTRGLITMQGNLRPFVDFAATSSTSDGTATLLISGPANRPEVTVTADPERPPEEALAMLLFGNGFAELSPFKIAQIASSLATLSGAGPDPTQSLRKATGLDSLDVGTDNSGAGRVGAGAYISEQIYTDVSVNSRGETELNLNLDVSDNITLKGTVDNTGSTGIGAFFERDY